jgi:hypothetical protein
MNILDQLQHAAYRTLPARIAANTVCAIAPSCCYIVGQSPKAAHSCLAMSRSSLPFLPVQEIL